MNSVGRHRVIDSVTAYEQHAVSVTHVVALHPNLGIIRKLPDAAVQLVEVLVPWSSPHCSKEYRQMPIRSLSADPWTWIARITSRI